MRLAHCSVMQVRITGESAEVDEFLVWLRERGATVAGDERRYGNRSGSGQRAYITVELPTETRECS